MQFKEKVNQTKTLNIGVFKEKIVSNSFGQSIKTSWNYKIGQNYWTSQNWPKQSDTDQNWLKLTETKTFS